MLAEDRPSTGGRASISRSGRRFGLLVSWLLGLSAVLCIAAPVLAQTDDLRARQVALADEIARNPTDLDLMFAYAVTSMQLEDYEPAIATLERMLIFNPDLPRVRLELAVAYFRLGVYDVSRFYFESVDTARAPEEVQQRVASFLAEIDRRTARSGFSGFVALGPVFSTNANLGPPDREIRWEFTGGTALIDESGVQKEDFGFQALVSVTHSYDLRRPRDDVWLSSFTYNGRRFFDEKDGDLDALVVTTGPRLAVDDEAFGLKARPYISGGLVRSGNYPLYTEGGFGVEVSQTIDRELAVFGVASVDWRDFTKSRDSFDGLYGGLFAGLAYTPTRDREYRLAALGRTDRTSEQYTSSNEAGVRLGVTQVFFVDDLPWASGSVLPWRFTVFSQLSGRLFDGPDPDVDRNSTRSDIDGRLGARLITPISVNSALAADIGYFQRFSNIENYDFNSLDVGISFIRFF